MSGKGHTKKNKGMTAASVFSITAMLLILGLFFTIVVNLDLATESVRDDYDTIEVYYPDKAKAGEIEKQKGEIQQWENVKSVEYRSKDEALKIMKKRWGENGYLLDSLKDNPLPNSLVIHVKDIEESDAVAKKAEKLKGIEDIRYYKDTVDKLVKVTRAIQIAGIIIIAFLIIISIVIVVNTIKLTVINRSEEIGIMKYVGATNWFIRKPFLKEGILIGGASALIAAGITTLVYSRVAAAIEGSVSRVLGIQIFPTTDLAIALFALFIALGVIIGALGSMISMKKFLDV